MRTRSEKTIPDAQETTIIFGGTSPGYTAEIVANGRLTITTTKYLQLRQSSLVPKYTGLVGKKNLQRISKWQ